MPVILSRYYLRWCDIWLFRNVKPFLGDGGAVHVSIGSASLGTKETEALRSFILFMLLICSHLYFVFLYFQFSGQIITEHVAKSNHRSSSICLQEFCVWLQWIPLACIVFLRGKCIWMSSKQWHTFKSIKLDLFDFWSEITVIKFLKNYKFLFRVTTSQQHYSCCVVARMAEERICCSVSTVLIKWLTFSCFVYFMQNYFAEMQVMTSCNLLGCLHIRIHENKRQRRKLCAP